LRPDRCTFADFNVIGHSYLPTQDDVVAEGYAPGEPAYFASFRYTRSEGLARSSGVTPVMT